MLTTVLLVASTVGLAYLLCLRLTGTSFTNYSAGKVLEHALRNTSWTSPSTVYMALFTVAPTDSSGGTEVTGGSYARQAMTFAAASGTPRKCVTSADITFPTATANWGTVVAWAIMDASTGGNMIFYNTLPSSQIINTDGVAVFKAGDVSVTVD